MLSTPPWTAYLKIAEGCDHACAFCAIPSIRGPYTSKPLDRVLSEAAELASRGVVELNLIAQDTTRYGADLPGRRDLRVLLRELCEVDGVRWIRVLYAYPDRGLAELAEAMAGLPKVCAYLVVPLQHSDPGILRAMRRPGSGDEYIQTLRRLREALPGLAVRTTLIVGFPGETDGVFEGLVRFVEEAGFDRLGVFEFSPEPGTAAASMPDQIPACTRRARRDRLMRVQQEVSLDRNRAWVGREMDVLVESGGHCNGRRQATGRSFRDGPEVDGSVVIAASAAAPGSFKRVRITDADVYDLRGVEVTPATDR
jgi:ribosomal protein S12 methylthiotransferase